MYLKPARMSGQVGRNASPWGCPFVLLPLGNNFVHRLCSEFLLKSQGKISKYIGYNFTYRNNHSLKVVSWFQRALYILCSVWFAIFCSGLDVQTTRSHTCHPSFLYSTSLQAKTRDAAKAAVRPGITCSARLSSLAQMNGFDWKWDTHSSTGLSFLYFFHIEVDMLEVAGYTVSYTMLYWHSIAHFQPGNVCIHCLALAWCRCIWNSFRWGDRSRPWHRDLTASFGPLWFRWLQADSAYGWTWLCMYSIYIYIRDILNLQLQAFILDKVLMPLSPMAVTSEL